MLYSLTYKEVESIKLVPPETEIDIDLYDFEHLTGNFMIMLGVGVASLILLIVVEAGLFNKCSECSCRSLPKQEELKDCDEDVAAEEKRLDLQSKVSLSMRQSYKLEN